MAEADYYQDGESIDYTPVAACSAGEVVQLNDGRAAVCPTAIAAGIKGSASVKGIYKFAKTASQVHLPGQRIYWDMSASTATCVPSVDAGDFFLGTATADSAAATTTTTVDINADYIGTIDQRRDIFAVVPVLTAGDPRVYNVGGAMRFTIDATNEAQKIDALSLRSVPVAGDWIFFAEVNVAAAAGGATDITIGMANGTHATDFQSVTEFVTIHIDGGSANILVQSDDGTTDLAPVDSTFDWTAGTIFAVAIDGRVVTDTPIYINGVQEAGAGTPAVAVAAGPLKACVHIEKTSSTDAATVEVANMKVVTIDV